MKHVVMFSGGIASWMTARLVINEHGPADTVLLFADDKGDPTNTHCGEDTDCYRFINETANKFGTRLVIVQDGRNIWQVFKDHQFIGNSRLAPCSHDLKQRPCRTWLDTHCDPTVTTVYVGIDFTEMHRLAAVTSAYHPFTLEAPLTKPPYVDKDSMLKICRADGITPPRMYASGWPHANCQGACVRAGQAQWRKLLSLHPDIYAYHENEEQNLREHLNKDVSILRDRTGLEPVPLTLRTFRERIQNGQQSLFNLEDFNYEWGGCGCFTDYEKPDPETIGETA